MKTIYKIAKTELQVLFYSPVAWLILVIFTFQIGMTFADSFGGLVRLQHINIALRSITINTYAGWAGIFTNVLAYVYLYIPLLTMGIMSRELSSGSIKLLYSSPITNTQIILGKYLALMIFGLVLIGVLMIFGGFGMITINSVDAPFILTCLLGIYLLICAYAAIGLFMSSLTSYNVVAALGTLTILALLKYVKDVGQDIEFVRDITYWLAITGRSGTFISGMITSEDVLYFIIVISLFLGFTIIKLHSGRQKSLWFVTAGKYLAVFTGAMLLGYFSAKPYLKGYYDATRTKENTLSKSSQDVMAKLTGGFTIHTYSNMLDPSAYTALPSQYKSDVESFEKYIRFKPEIKMDYAYYYHHAENPQLDRMYPNMSDEKRLDTLKKFNGWNFEITPYSAISGKVNLEPENFRFVRVLERDNGQKTFLRIYDDMMRMPAESEITAAIKRLVMKLPVVGFVSGHGERESNGTQDRGYNMIAREKTFRYSMVNQGFDFVNQTLDEPVNKDINILMIAEPKQALTAKQQQNLDDYIARGGNLLLAGEPGRQEQMNAITSQLGVKFMPGRIVKKGSKLQSDLLIMRPTEEASKMAFYMEDMYKKELVITMPSTSGLDDSNAKAKGFNVSTIFRTDSTESWNELETTNFVDDSVKLNPSAGEIEKSYPVMLALTRKINGKQQKILVSGDADWLSNGEISMNRNGVQAANFFVIASAFSWLSNGEVPIDVRHDTPPDTSISIGEGGWKYFNILFKWGIPGLLIAASILIWVRRRGR